jgi:hypothetical protein
MASGDALRLGGAGRGMVRQARRSAAWRAGDVAARMSSHSGTERCGLPLFDLAFLNNLE